MHITSPHDNGLYGLKPGTYVLAVSGGIDSMVLLELLWQVVLPPRYTLIVAHFDHGIRPDSAQDAAFVAQVAAAKGLQFVSERVELGHGASEDTARQARYDFLWRTKQRFYAHAIITAHHKNDLLETVALHLRRGSGRRGLDPMRTWAGIERPLLHYTKQDLALVAQNYGLEWREDSTNNDMTYARNAVRQKMAQADPQLVDALYDLHTTAVGRNNEIDMLLDQLADWLLVDDKLHRPRYVVLPYAVQKEFAHWWLVKNGVPDVSKQMIGRVVHAIAVAHAGKAFDLKTGYALSISKNVVEILQKCPGN